jgi:hypothetical protein
VISRLYQFRTSDGAARYRGLDVKGTIRATPAAEITNPLPFDPDATVINGRTPDQSGMYRDLVIGQKGHAVYALAVMSRTQVLPTDIALLAKDQFDRLP